MSYVSGLTGAWADGTHLDSVAAAPGMHRFRSSSASGPHPLSPRAIFRLHDDRLDVSETLEPSIRVFDLDGTQVGEIEVPGDFEPAQILEDEVVGIARGPL